MDQQYMRYVVGTDADGKSSIHSKGFATSIVDLGVCRIIDYWAEPRTPCNISGNIDNAPDTLLHEPAVSGHIYRMCEFRPDCEIGDKEAQIATTVSGHARIATKKMPTAEELAAEKHPSMHETKTLNYAYIVSGQIWMLTDKEDVLLKQGDAMIIRGARRGWRVEGDEPCVILGVLIDAEPRA